MADPTEPEVGRTEPVAAPHIDPEVDHIVADHCTEVEGGYTVVDRTGSAEDRCIGPEVDPTGPVEDYYMEAVGCQIGLEVDTGLVTDHTDPEVGIGFVVDRMDCCQKKDGVVVEVGCYKSHYTAEVVHKEGLGLMEAERCYCRRAIRG